MCGGGQTGTRRPPATARAGRGAGTVGGTAPLRGKQGQRKWRLHVTERAAAGLGAAAAGCGSPPPQGGRWGTELTSFPPPPPPRFHRPGRRLRTNGCGPTAARREGGLEAATPTGAGDARQRFSGGCGTAPTLCLQPYERPAFGLSGFWWKSDFTRVLHSEPKPGPLPPRHPLVKLSVAQLLGPSDCRAKGWCMFLALEALRNVQLVGHRRAVTAPATWSCLCTIISYFSTCKEATGSFFFPSIA